MEMKLVRVWLNAPLRGPSSNIATYFCYKIDPHIQEIQYRLNYVLILILVIARL